MITLKHIAEEAQVSIMTVSRVMNGNHDKVSSETTKRIQIIADRLGYIPNSSARSLAAKSSKIIALLINGYDSDNPLSDTYNAIFLGEVMKCVQTKGYYIMPHFIDDYQDINFRLHSWNVDGAIFLGMFDKKIEQLKNDNQIPLLFTDSYSSIRQITNVGIDDYKGGILAAEHFIKKGHKRFAFAGPALSINGVVRHRYQGFCDTLQKNGLTLDDPYVFCFNHNDDTGGLIQTLTESPAPPTAIFTTSDTIAFQIMESLQNKGLQIPRDYSIIGFDDFPISRQSSPKLTTIRQDISGKAKLTAELLFKHIQFPHSPSENIILDVTLVERESVAKI